MIDSECRNASSKYWEFDGVGCDIITYRLHKPGINSRANDDRLEKYLNECIGQIAPVEWDKNGLPLVGVRCEMADENGQLKEVEVIAWRNKCVIGWDSERLIAYISNNPSDFRPLRTEAERAREDAETAMRTCLAGTGAGITPLAAKGIYEAIAAGKIPDVKLEDK